MSKHPPVCMRVRWWAHATTTMHHAASSSYAWRAVAGCSRDGLALLVGMRASSLRQVLSSRALALPAALNKPSRLSHSGRYAADVGSVVSCEGGLSQSCEDIPVKPITCDDTTAKHKDTYLTRSTGVSRGRGIGIKRSPALIL